MSRRFNLQVNQQDAMANLEQFLEGMAHLRERTKGFGVLSEAHASQIAIAMFLPLHEELVNCLRQGAAPQKRLAADYLNARAYFYGMGKRTADGQRFMDDAATLARGGDWAEHCQDYYHLGH